MVLLKLGSEKDDGSFKWKPVGYTGVFLVISCVFYIIQSQMYFNSIPHVQSGAVNPRDLIKLQQMGCFVDPLSHDKDTMQQTGTSVAKVIQEECESHVQAKLDACPIPAVVHLVSGPSFKFHHYVSIMSAYYKFRPSKIYLHGYGFDSESEWLDKAIDRFGVELVLARPAYSIYRHVLEFPEHRGDLNRLEALIRYGGIYLDLDAYALASVDDLLHYESVIGTQNGDYGLNNGIMMAKRCSKFYMNWHAYYQTFEGGPCCSGAWDDHSVKLPRKLYNAYNWTNMKVVDDSMFFNNPHNLIMFGHDWKANEYPNLRAIHSFYRWFGKSFDEKSILDENNNFGRLYKHLIGQGELFV